MISGIDRKTSLLELGAVVCDALKRAGIDAFLSGGAVVSIYTENRYESYDLDFVTIADRRKIHEVMLRLGFDRTKSRLYVHPDSEFSVEFPGAALLIGDQPIREFAELKVPQGTLKLLTPTDCVKDRLAAYYHWNDRQGLNQAAAVATAHPVNLLEIELWSKRERMTSKFRDLIDLLRGAGVEKVKELASEDDEAGPKVHPWRFCPLGKHAVKTHPLTIPPSRRHPSGVTPRHFHCAKNPSGKEILTVPEIEAIAQKYFSGLAGPPCALPLGFKNGSAFDDLIRGWVKYWNEVLEPDTLLDPNLVKALIASEAGFNVKSGASRKGRNAARGLMQLDAVGVRALGNEKGEIKDHYVILKSADRFDANVCICAGVRWLFQKRVFASIHLKRQASWEETVEEFKGVLKARLNGKKVDPKLMGIFRKFLKECMECGKKT